MVDPPLIMVSTLGNCKSGDNRTLLNVPIDGRNYLINFNKMFHGYSASPSSGAEEPLSVHRESLRYLIVDVFFFSPRSLENDWLSTTLSTLLLLLVDFVAAFLWGRRRSYQTVPRLNFASFDEKHKAAAFVSSESLVILFLRASEWTRVPYLIVGLMELDWKTREPPSLRK